MLGRRLGQHRADEAEQHHDQEPAVVAEERDAQGRRQHDRAGAQDDDLLADPLWGRSLWRLNRERLTFVTAAVAPGIAVSRASLASKDRPGLSVPGSARRPGTRPDTARRSRLS